MGHVSTLNFLKNSLFSSNSIIGLKIKESVERVVLVANQRQIIDIVTCHVAIATYHHVLLSILLENDVTRFARVLVGLNLPGDLRLKCYCTGKRRESLQPGVAR